MKRIVILIVGVLVVAALSLAPTIASAHHHGRAGAHKRHHRHHQRVRGVRLNGTTSCPSQDRSTPTARKSDDGSGEGRDEHSGASGPTGPSGAGEMDDQGENHADNDANENRADNDANEDQNDNDQADQAGEGATGPSGPSGPSGNCD